MKRHLISLIRNPKTYYINPTLDIASILIKSAILLLILLFSITRSMSQMPSMSPTPFPAPPPVEITNINTDSIIRARDSIDSVRREMQLDQNILIQQKSNESLFKQQSSAPLKPLLPKGLDVDISHYQPPNRIVNDSQLIIKDENGSIVFDFRNSPCFSELGYNVDMSQENNLRLYKACESEKQIKSFKKALPYVLSFIIITLAYWGITYSLNSNRRKWNNVRNHYDTEEYFKEIIDKFLIPDNISFEKYNSNDRSGKDSYQERINAYNNISYSYTKYIQDANFDKPVDFPNWFFSAYPDVTVWYVKNQNSINSRYYIKVGQIDLSFLRAIVNDFCNIYKQLELKY